VGRVWSLGKEGGGGERAGKVQHRGKGVDVEGILHSGGARSKVIQELKSAKGWVVRGGEDLW